ncbi:hypothetical protein AG2_015 [Listeria phage vB_LmoM_AG20]|uniref:Uncharacterized protein n=1 Tax=Listeria phage vB_LmoM_AG20 TaxID=1168744 RepID=M4GZX0_9CAUD|nr:hypothetical protein AG2_015 [Listeria phage vB_LmoM_AG20]AFJ75952.1 hypothetical protein AG2_015 [Listeria phage vB_LmoM_AG20]QIG60769.1 hypothetical protein vBLinoVEfB7_026 [Listeria phage vB_Lino_VEfB7]QKN84223.1 hypothetical protein [Listeria virus P61]WIW77245.1 hypothetical protein CKA15_018 [Listeria phage cka15]
MSNKKTDYKVYKITYKQRFMGEVLVDSYERAVRDDNELQSAINALYDDPHVFSVSSEEVTE